MKLRVIHISVSLCPIRALACNGVTAVEQFDVPAVGSTWHIGSVLCQWKESCYEMHLYNVGDDKSGCIYFRKISVY